MSEMPRSDPQRVSAPDFLWRVIDRAFERAAPIEPRLRSLFEPHDQVAAAGGTWLAELARADEDEIASNGADADTDSGVSGAHARRAARDSAAAVEPGRESGAAPHRYSRLSARPPQAGSAGTLPPEEHSPRATDTHRDSLARAERESLHRMSNPPDAVLLPREISASMDEAGDSATARTTLQAPEVAGRSAERSENRQEESVSPASPMQRIAIEPPTVSHRPKREPIHEEEAARSPEPIVNVTIGRVEIRAVPAPRASARQRSQGPKPMSLDEYLKRRGGGR
jgi:hypothetical protein